MNSTQPRLLLPLGLSAFILCFVALLVPTAQADTINVCAACSVTSIQTAVNQAMPGDTIQLSAETYSETVTITQSLTIAGTSEAGTIWDGNEASTVITVSMGITVALQNLTIQDGLSDFDGGGILNDGSLTLNSVTLKNNVAETGGGIANYGTLNLTAVTLDTNTAGSQGGGIFNVGMVSMSDSRVVQNRAAFEGPGIYNEGMMTLQTVQIQQNIATAEDNLGGGGIYNTNGGQVTLSQNSVVTGNEAAVGAGILNQDLMTITNSIISENMASSLGGGLVNEGTITVSNSEIIDNESMVDGGAMFNTNSAVFSNVRFADNNAVGEEGRGGAILNGGTLAISQSSLIDNSAHDGGAIHNLADLQLTNVTVSGNSAGNAGAGVHSDGNTAVFLHVTFFDNIAAGAGSAVYQIDGSVTVTNSVLARGVAAGAGACSGTITSGGGNLSDDTTCALNGIQDRNGVVVSLAALNGDDVHLPALNSLLIDNAITASCPAADQLGMARPFGLGCDSGAIETAVLRSFIPFVNR